MIDQEFFDYLETNLTDYVFKYGSAENTDYPFVVVRKISDMEIADSLCKDQGDSGDALFQFSCYTGLSSAESLIYADKVKVEVAKILAKLTTIQIYSNRTTGATIMSDGLNTNLIWSAMFETTIRWGLI